MSKQADIWRVQGVIVVTLLAMSSCAASPFNTPIASQAGGKVVTSTVESSSETQPPPSGSEIVTQSSSVPAVVDVAKVTPQVAEGSTPIKMPAPGVPDPTTQLVQRLKLDLATQINVDISQIETEKVEAVTWPDTSLGCPQPGILYSQILVDGYRVTLKANSAEFDYHTQGTEEFVLCKATQ